MTCLMGESIHKTPQKRIEIPRAQTFDDETKLQQLDVHPNSHITKLCLDVDGSFFKRLSRLDNGSEAKFLLVLLSDPVSVHIVPSGFFQ